MTAPVKVKLNNIKIMIKSVNQNYNFLFLNSLKISKQRIFLAGIFISVQPFYCDVIMKVGTMVSYMVYSNQKLIIYTL